MQWSAASVQLRSRPRLCYGNGRWYEWPTPPGHIGSICKRRWPAICKSPRTRRSNPGAYKWYKESQQHTSWTELEVVTGWACKICKWTNHIKSNQKRAKSQCTQDATHWYTLGDPASSDSSEFIHVCPPTCTYVRFVSRSVSGRSISLPLSQGASPGLAAAASNISKLFAKLFAHPIPSQRPLSKKEFGMTLQCLTGSTPWILKRNSHHTD